MQKKIVFVYNWWNSENEDNPIPVHHETRLMGYAERTIFRLRKMNIKSGSLKYTYKEANEYTPYVGMWSVRYEN